MRMEDHDEEALYREADVFTGREIARENYLARLRKQGVCTHNHVFAASKTGEIFYPEQRGLTGEQRRCSGCGRVFESDRDWAAARAAV